MNIGSGINGTSEGVNGNEKLAVDFYWFCWSCWGDLAIISESSTEGSRAQRWGRKPLIRLISCESLDPAVPEDLPLDYLGT